MLPELNDEPTGLEEIDETITFEDELAVRNALIRMQQLERDLEKASARRKAVEGAYRQQEERIQRDIGWLRKSLQDWLERGGEAKFPDVGTAYLQRGDARIEIVDAAAFKEALSAMFTKEVFDETGAKRYALEQATTAGELVAGTALVPGGPSLRIRKA